MDGAVQGANLAGAQADYLRGVTPALQLADNITRTPTQVDQTGRHSYSGVYSPNNQTLVSNNTIPLTNPMGDYGQPSNIDWSQYQIHSYPQHRQDWIRSQNQQLQG